FTGRSFTAPIVRQYLFLPPGGYHLQGEFMAPKLRAEEGLAWSVQCTAGRKAVLGRSTALRETGGVWKQLEFDFTVPPDSGSGAGARPHARSGGRVRGHDGVPRPRRLRRIQSHT